MTAISRAGTFVVATVLATGAASAQANVDDPDAGTLEELVVYGRAQSLLGRAGSASEGVVGYDDIRLPPLLRVGELVESVPGLVATQHSGSGKANQYFIRGFKLDHGTDFSVSVDDVPVNQRSHAHGQGYLDLNFLIPELVEVTRYRRGPYATAAGDFSTAASVDFELYDRIAAPLVTATVGEYGYLRAVAAGSAVVGGGTLTAAVDATGYDGPWDLPENLEQARLMAFYHGEIGGVGASLSLQVYDSDWNATDQVPERAVAAGLIDPLGNVDPDLGGNTSRYALSGSLDYGQVSVNAYVIDYDLSLFSNFTYFLDDTLDGDEFEQRDSRRVYGLGIDGERLGSDSALTLRWGADLRLDDIDEVGLYGTVNRVRTATVRRDAVHELSIAAFGEVEYALTDRLRAIVGLRADYYDWQVTAFRARNSGSGSDTLVSPKASLAWQFTDGAEAYFSVGRGFHSNDVRGATIAIDPASGDPANPVPALVGADGAELGLRLERGSAFNATVTAFWLGLDSELVYVGDAGTTEPSDASERLGVEAATFWQASDWLAVNAAWTATDAEFVTDQGGGRDIPGAVESTFTLGLNFAWDSGVFASTRFRWLGEAPLVEDDSVRSDDSLLVNAGVGYRAGRLEYRLDAFNLLDSDDDDIAYYYASRLPGEPLAGVEDRHFHPLEPRSLRASVTWRWN